MNEAMADAIKTTTLEKLKVASMQQIGASILADSAVVDVAVDFLTGDLVARLTSYVLAEHLATDARTFDYAWPASGWHRFKLNRLNWFVRHHLLRKVKMHRESVRIDVKSWATFPHTTLVTPELGRPVYLQQVDARRIRQGEW